MAREERHEALAGGAARGKNADGEARVTGEPLAREAVERREDCPDAEETHQRVIGVELREALRAREQRERRRGNDGAGHRDPPHRHPVGEVTHHDAAKPRSDRRDRVRERNVGARPPELRGKRREEHRHGEQHAEPHGGHHGGHRNHEPGALHREILRSIRDRGASDRKTAALVRWIALEKNRGQSPSTGTPREAGSTRCTSGRNANPAAADSSSVPAGSNTDRDSNSSDTSTAQGRRPGPRPRWRRSRGCDGNVPYGAHACRGGRACHGACHGCREARACRDGNVASRSWDARPSHPTSACHPTRACRRKRLPPWRHRGLPRPGPG